MKPIHGTLNLNVILGTARNPALGLESGDRFPLRLDEADGTRLDLIDGHLVACMQIPGASAEELMAFAEGPDRYALWEPQGLPVPVLTFRFGAPLGLSEFNIDMRHQATPEQALNLIEQERGEIMFCLVEHNRVRMRFVLPLAASTWEGLRQNLRRQLSTPYCEADFVRAVEQIQSHFSLTEVFAAGQQFPPAALVGAEGLDVESEGTRH